MAILIAMSSALSWQTGFCQSQHDRNRNERDECRLQTETTNKADFLTVHGLWPGLPKSVAARGVDERRWMRFGCATRPIPNLPEARASRMCSSPETGLSLETAAKLSEVMPGAGGRSCLNATNMPNTVPALVLIRTHTSVRWYA